jgi:hypothetical protein
MKRHHYIPVVLSFVIALLILPSTALAAKTSKFKGQSADVYFNSFEGCIQTTVIVFANEDTAKQGGYESGVSFYLGQYDTCAGGVPLVELSGFAPLDDAAFQGDPKLNAATLDTTLEVFDYVTQAPTTVNITINWIGIGAIGSGKSNAHFNAPGCKYHITSNGTFRSAQPSGTVSYGETTLTLTQFESASLQSVKNGSLIVGCGL